MADAVRVEDLWFTYERGGAPALRGISLVVPEGRFHCLIGPTGAGKTTLLSALSRIVPRFFKGTPAGRIELFGAPIAEEEVATLARTVGTVFQDFEAQIFATDALAEVAFGMENLGVPPAEMRARATAALARVGLAGFEGRDTASLSGGEKQRLAIAAVLAMGPRLVVLDEPTTDLDPVGKREVLAVAMGLARAGHTVVLVEHDLEAITGADRVHVLVEGRVVAEGEPIGTLGRAADLAALGVRPPELATIVTGLGLPCEALDVERVARQLAPVLAWDDDRVRAITRDAADDLAGDAAVRLEGVRFGYGARPVLDGVDLTIRRGEITAILGRNGSGKTTLVKLINGLLRPAAGRVLLGGDDTAAMGVSAIGRRVGFVFQNPDHQLFRATVREEVAFGLTHAGVPEAEHGARIAEALAAVRLTGAEDRDPFILGKGERQRVAVASVLACRPEVIVLDEPTTGLDHREQRAMMDLLLRLRESGRTIVVVTHAMWVVAACCRRAVLLAGGKVIADGPTREVFHRPGDIARAGIVAPPAAQLAARWGRKLLTPEEFVACARAEGG
jgi:energy-coupling factor transport system ATP-binding protein